MSDKLPYQPALDGLRGIAVASVVAYHLGYLRGGFLGVDIFFVLSGFLITSLLLNERREHGSIDLRRFWARRARRLFPALLLLLAFLALADGVHPWDGFRADGLATLFYVANWHLIRARSYFDQFAAPSPLKHAWSLAIEEQFYLLWPLVMGFVASRRRALRGIVVAILASVAVESILFNRADPSAAYYNTVARAHELLVGALLAFGVPRVLRRLSIPSCVLVIGAIAMLPDKAAFYYHGGSVLFAVLVASIIAGQPRALSLRPVRELGKISYGVYLWHWPILLLLTPRIGVSGIALNAARVVLTLGVAAASYRWIEQPIRRGRLRRARLAAIPATGLVFVLLSTAAVPAVSSAIAKAAAVDGGEDRPGLQWKPVSLRGSGPPVVLVGDSVAVVLARAFQRASGWTLVNAARRGCAPTGALTTDEDGVVAAGTLRCHELVASLQRAAIERYRPSTVIWYSQTEALPIRIGDRLVETGPEHDDVVRALLSQAYRRLTAKGGTLVAVLPARWPAPSAGCSDTTVAGACANMRSFNIALARYRDVLSRFAATHDHFAVVDVDGLVCGPGECPFTYEGLTWRPDFVHYAPAAAVKVAACVVAFIRSSSLG